MAFLKVIPVLVADCDIVHVDPFLAFHYQVRFEVPSCRAWKSGFFADNCILDLCKLVDYKVTYLVVPPYSVSFVRHTLP